ncbi:hypothetical protein QMK19_39095 [Streptomyces sp. H10-C2]|uniref:DUF6884 domain-containing protein n=1 Tax=unclassified Streptomyces TaxID=2593676 RepID=UPI0024BB8B5A|nr:MULTISPECIES: DUF6884 domain-containing protein [unclassified Streptomyces]MDJ0347209.1 hypothetical protein [Streptomyces sp. PH10-H1]MDJ0375443.1 hypothetical protein [Streptomyces sp. H10-C2]
MTNLSPTGAQILATNADGVVTGHPAAMARLESDGLVRLTRQGRTMTDAGREALLAWQAEHPHAPERHAGLTEIHPKLPAKQHEAVVSAARRPDQLVPGRVDQAYWDGDTWFRRSTLTGVHRAGYGDIRPESWDREPATWDTTDRSLYLNPRGRAYARQRGGIDVRRRQVVIIACGQEKQPDPGLNEYGNLQAGYPAGELYTGQYHRSLRRAADELTDQSLIRICSAAHGLVPLNRFLRPYDVRVGDERAVTAQSLAHHTASLGLADADVIVLGGHDYVELLQVSVPHLLAPLVGGMGEHRGQCRQAAEDGEMRAMWWEQASQLHHLHHSAS